jgi:diaminohydroxyphosphoribosylaminopyrimidine deaminase / 5-amino-6-(5-phosphoribosylamino)uracil reductase
MDPADAGVIDQRHMRRALRLAESGWGRVAPNPLVGAVIVRHDEVVGEGCHTEYGLPHAEIEALRAAGDRARGASLYVTLEPCAHQGKTPPCTEAILQAGVARVVFAATDPDPRAAGGAEVLRRAGVEVVAGIESAAAMEQNAPFFFSHSREGADRPWIALKLALSLDAKLADATGRSVWITGEEARAEVHRLRAGFDAIAVGIGTALADDPRLTVRGAVSPRTPPVRVVFDRLLRLQPTSYLASSARDYPTWLICSADSAADRGSRLEALGIRLVPAESLGGGLRALRALGIRSLLCEGGAGIAGALFELAAVDRMYIFYAPILLGGASRAAFANVPATAIDAVSRWRRLETRAFGDDTLITLAR